MNHVDICMLGFKCIFYLSFLIIALDLILEE